MECVTAALVMHEGERSIELTRGTVQSIVDPKIWTIKTAKIVERFVKSLHMGVGAASSLQSVMSLPTGAN